MEYEDVWKPEDPWGFYGPSLYSQHSKSMVKYISQPINAIMLYQALWTPFLERHDQPMVPKHHLRLTQGLRYVSTKTRLVISDQGTQWNVIVFNQQSILVKSYIYIYASLILYVWKPFFFKSGHIQRQISIPSFVQIPLIFRMLWQVFVWKLCHIYRVSYQQEWLEIQCVNWLIIVAVPFGCWKANGSAATKTQTGVIHHIKIFL